LIGVPVAVFGVGTVAGFAAAKRGIPPDQMGRWLLKESTRKALGCYDELLDVLPDQDGVRLSDALEEAPLPGAQPDARKQVLG